MCNLLVRGKPITITPLCQINAEQQLVFSLRVNPIVTRLSEAGKKQRHDVVMDLKKRMDYQSMPKADRPSITLSAIHMPKGGERASYENERGDRNEGYNMLLNNQLE